MDRCFLGISFYYVGSHRSKCLLNYKLIEDDFCSSGELGLCGFALNELEPLEAQARGFSHGHRKVYGFPEAIGPELLRQFKDLRARKPETSAGVAKPAHPHLPRSKSFSLKAVELLSNALALCSMRQPHSLQRK